MVDRATVVQQICIDLGWKSNNRYYHHMGKHEFHTCVISPTRNFCIYEGELFKCNDTTIALCSHCAEAQSSVKIIDLSNPKLDLHKEFQFWSYKRSST